MINLVLKGEYDYANPESSDFDMQVVLSNGYINGYSASGSEYSAVLGKFEVEQGGKFGSFDMNGRAQLFDVMSKKPNGLYGFKSAISTINNGILQLFYPALEAADPDKIGMISRGISKTVIDSILERLDQKTDLDSVITGSIKIQE